MPTDRVLNLMCGSGTLLVERLLAGPASEAVGVDLSEAAVAASTANLAAAGLTAQVLQGDALAPVPGSFDLLLADPPWGTLHGSHESNAALHAGLLTAAYEAAAPGARLVVLTHEIKIMERAVRDADALWHVRDQVRVFAKGHHPRIYVLDRT